MIGRRMLVGSVAVAGLLAFADVAWGLDPRDFGNANQLAWDEEFNKDAEAFFGAASGKYLGWSGSVYEQWSSAFGGPPEQIDSIPVGWQFAACRFHSCDEKAWVLLDEHGQIRLAALRHFFTRDGTMSDDAMLTIFFRDPAALQYRMHALNWSRRHGSVAVIEMVELN
jgi:hypothetical protein